MADHDNVTQEHNRGDLHDKENWPNSPERNQRKEVSVMTPRPPKESGALAERTNISKCSAEMGKNSAEKMNEKVSGCNWLTDAQEKSKLKRKDQKDADPPKKKPKSASPRRTEGNSSGKKLNNESIRKEKKGEICVSYKWNKQGERSDTTGLNTPIIDFIQKVNKKIKESNYLFVCAQKYKAIVNPWVPCGALQPYGSQQGGEVLELDLRKIKASRSSKCEQDEDKIVGPERSEYSTCHDGLFFKVRHQGKTEGGQPVIILEKKQYYSKDYPVAVFGLKGWTIQEALQNDKRFTIQGEFRLEDSHCRTKGSDILLSDLLSDTYTIVVDRKKTRNQLSEKSVAHTDLQNDAEGDTSPLPGPSVPQSEPPVDPPGLPLPASSRLCFRFSEQFQKFAKTIGEKELKSHLVKDYGKILQDKELLMPRTLRLLPNHLDHVGLLSYEIEGVGGKSGTFFMVTEELGVTCYHVVKLLIKSKIKYNVKVIFNYESENAENIFYGEFIKVVWTNRKLDCAFLRIKKAPSLPGLLQYISPPPQEGAVSIIGHPNGRHKKVDLFCSVVNYKERAESIADTILSDRSYVHVLTQHNFMCMNDPTLVTYDTCLYWGASGAPVFDYCGELVAVHLGGYPAITTLQKKSVIEYGRSVVDLTIHAAIYLNEIRVPLRKLVEEKQSLRNYLQPGGHPVKMQPTVRRLLEEWKKRYGPINLNPSVNGSDRGESGMDTSCTAPEQGS